jgi:peptide/nickel transport system substrate-binding protein
VRLVDRAVVLGGLLLLVLLGGSLVILSAPRPTPAATPTPPLTTATERVLREGLVGQVRTLDPLYATDPAERDISALIFSGLVRLGPNGKLLPDLARAWQVSSAGRVYDFDIREEARWHDGEPVTADDVVFTVLSLQHPDYDGPGAGPWKGIMVERLSAYRVRFRLPTPSAGFLVLATQPIVPGHILASTPVAERRTAPFGQRPVGNGPFRLETLTATEVDLTPAAPSQAKPESDRSLDPFDGPAQPTPKPATGPRRPGLDRYRFLVYESADAAARAFRSGEIDALGGMGVATVRQLAGLSGVRGVRYPRTILTAVVLNLHFEMRAYRDARVRRALLAAIDRQAIVDELLGDRGTVAQTPISPASFAYARGAAGSVPYQPGEAKRLLKAAGWKVTAKTITRPGTDRTSRIELLTVDRETNRLAFAVAQRVARDWRAIGLRVKVTGLSREQLVSDRLVPGRFAAAVLDVNLGLDPDLYPLLASSQAVTGGTNVSGYQSADMDALLAAARRYADAPTRRKHFIALQKELAKELPILPIFFGDYVYLMRDSLQGPAPREIATPSDRFWDVLTWRTADGSES